MYECFLAFLDSISFGKCLRIKYLFPKHVSNTIPSTSGFNWKNILLKNCCRSIFVLLKKQLSSDFQVLVDSISRSPPSQFVFAQIITEIIVMWHFKGFIYKYLVDLKLQVLEKFEQEIKNWSRFSISGKKAWNAIQNSWRTPQRHSSHGDGL